MLSNTTLTSISKKPQLETKFSGSNLLNNDTSTVKLSTTLSKLKNFVDKIISSETTVNKVKKLIIDKKESADETNFDYGDYVIKINKTDNMLADFTNPFFVKSGAPSTKYVKKDFKEISHTKYFKRKTALENFNNIDKEITEAILKDGGFEKILDHKMVSEYLLGRAKSNDLDASNNSQI